MFVYVISFIIDDVEFAKMKLDKIYTWFTVKSIRRVITVGIFRFDISYIFETFGNYTRRYIFHFNHISCNIIQLN